MCWGRARNHWFAHERAHTCQLIEKSEMEKKKHLNYIVFPQIVHVSKQITLSEQKSMQIGQSSNSPMRRCTY